MADDIKQSSVTNGPQTIREVLLFAVRFLGREHRLEAELILAAVLDTDRTHLLSRFAEKIDTPVKEEYMHLIHKLAAGEPLQYLLGRQEFFGRGFKVARGVLIPRHDTEVLVRTALSEIKENGIRKVLELCTGSGIIAVTLAAECPNLEVLAVDISPTALCLARENAAEHEVEKRTKIFESDLFRDVDGRFPLIIANPPYLSAREMDELSPQVKKEPATALYGGEDGLDFYRWITADAPAYLEKAGSLLLEIGWQQATAVSALCRENGFTEVTVLEDDARRDRVIRAVCP